MHKQKIKKYKLRTVIVLCLVAILLLCQGCSFGKEKENIGSLEEDVQSQANLNSVEWNGKYYTQNTDIETILFMGIDQDEAFKDKYLAGDAGQADCIMLLVFDKSTKQAKILQVNRNTMANLYLYDLNGNQGGRKVEQICLQYAYDIGGSSSCWSMVQVMRDILHDVDIDGYFALDMAGIVEINDALGGVDVTMNNDYTMIDESFNEGNTVHLEGALAESFVRYRDLDAFASVDDRMERQVDYVTAMIDSMKEKGTGGLYDTLSPYLDTYILTNMNAEQLNALTTYDYLMEDIKTLPGETIQNNEYEEYHLNEDALMKLIIDTFYIEVH